ncbi:MAG: flagellar biosynthetic protein FliR [Pseudomonadota bacterium]
MEDLILTIADIKVGRVFAIIAFTVMRPFALTFAFLAFTYAFAGSATIRMSIAVALGLPAGMAQLDALLAITANAGAPTLMGLAAKEFALGYGMGLFLSLPFFALQYAGAITDTTRGENDGGLTDPAGGTLQTFGVLYLVIGFFAFFSVGGMSLIVSILWRSYALFPIDTALPQFSAETGRLIAMLLSDTLLLALKVALPLLAVLMTIETVLAVAARLTRRMGLYDLAFPARNVAAIFLLPVVAWLVWQVSLALPDRAGDVLPLLETLVGP